MIEWERTLAPGYTVEQLSATHQQVRDHIASVADADDDPATLSDDVQVQHVEQADGSMLVRGWLDAEPDAPYLRPDYDPELEERPAFLVWTPADQPGWDPYDADPIEEPTS